MICPKCKEEFTLHPAISRKDGSKICPLCGSKEAIESSLEAGIISKEDAEETIKMLKEDFDKHNKCNP